MFDDASQKDGQILKIVSSIVTAYLTNNVMAADQVPGFIDSIHDTVLRLKMPATFSSNTLKPAVPIEKSVKPDYIICLEDGMKLKMLKRRLRTHYGMTPEDYRAKWGLPADYPMVAPNYAKRRKALAHEIGLGKRPSK